jgi:ABC-2 type transport system ATP-binding protein
MSAAIYTRELDVTREKNHILKSLTLEIGAGRISGLLGPSGSGKTTLMRTIAGLQKYQHGEIKVLAEDPGSKILRSEIAYSTQSASVYLDLTVKENLVYFASLHRVNEKSIDQILSEVDLEKNKHQLASALSGGERSRLALATTLVGSPKLLILDEPTVGLDPVLRIQLWKLFRGLADSGKTLLVSSHVMDEANYCDELYLMREGKILATGSPAELRSRTGLNDMSEVFVSLVEKQ